MKKVLVLGAGLVSRPLVKYLMDKGFLVTVATRTVSKAEALVEGNQNGRAVALNVEKDEELEKLVKEHDLTVSLLPYTYHVKVAKMCIAHKKDMATTSYVSPAMKELDGPARQAGIIILNEIGVDPGIDHMSAMKVMHDSQRRGGRITGFRSYCGGLPAPEANDNPYGYKFSWSPRGVLMAGKNNGRYLEDGEIVDIPGKDLFDNYWTLDIPGAGLLETYPNRDSLGYIDIYDVKDTRTMFRGTLRNLGWCNTLKKMADLGILSEEKDESYPGMTYLQFMGRLIGHEKGSIKEEVAKRLGTDTESPEMNAMEWLGLFGTEKIPAGVAPTPLDVLTDLMLRKMSYNPGERDMLVMHHQFEVEFDDHSEELTSTMVDYGIPHGDSSMARTVSLPCAIGVRMILDGVIKDKGVVIPVMPSIYEPVLKELENMDIRFTETRKVLNAC
jgi:saccharopine dehydrogenase-like NADP-dependent oxidoreductase